LKKKWPALRVNQATENQLISPKIRNKNPQSSTENVPCRSPPCPAFILRSFPSPCFAVAEDLKQETARSLAETVSSESREKEKQKSRLAVRQTTNKRQ
jgi:hypothetical protein